MRGRVIVAVVLWALGVGETILRTRFGLTITPGGLSS